MHKLKRQYGGKLWLFYFRKYEPEQIEPRIQNSIDCVCDEL